MARGRPILTIQAALKISNNIFFDQKVLIFLTEKNLYGQNRPPTAGTIRTYIAGERVVHLWSCAEIGFLVYSLKFCISLSIDE